MKRPRFLVLVGATAFLLRLAAVLALRDVREGPSPRHGADGVEYSQLAWHVARGDGYVRENGRPTAFRAPGFPLFLAAIYRVAGRNYLVAHVAFCLLGACGCLVAYAVARELLPEHAARLAGFLGVLYVPHVYLATVFFSENLSILCLGLGTWLFLRHLRTRVLGPLVLAGLCMGGATLTRTYALLILPAWACLLVRPRTLSASSFKRVAVFTAAWLIVVAPWALRNQAVLGRALIATNGGSTFYGGNNNRVLTERKLWGAWISTTELPGRDEVEAAPDEVRHDQVEWRLGREWVRAHLSAMPKLLAFKLVRFCLPDVESPNKAYTLLQVVGCSPFLVLFLLGGFRCLRERRCWTVPWLTLHFAFAASVATALIFWGSPRFRDANMPLLTTYAVLGLRTWFPTLSSENTPNPAPS